MNAYDEGAPLPLLAEHLGARGWQLVPTQWHRQGDKAANTPVNGVTGSAPFRTAADMARRTADLQLHREGGPDCTGRLAKPAIRPPLHAVGFDVDDGYAGKSGGDTLVEAEMMLGPLPGTWTLTARGQWSPSRRRWYRIPADLVVMDRFFRPYGGFIETIRTGHRYSWCTPAIHVRKGQVVGPVLWYGPDQQIAGTPHVDDLPALPAAWVQAIREDNTLHATPEFDRAPDVEQISGTGPATAVTPSYADAVVLKLARKLHEMPPAGGDFRSHAFGLAAALMRREIARQCDCANGGAHVLREFEQVFTEHPQNLRPDVDDMRWFHDGAEAGARRPWRFVDDPLGGLLPVLTPQPGTDPLDYPAAATSEEMATFLATYTRYQRPDRLGRRTAWLRNDEPQRLAWHARCMVQDVLDGHYPADRAVDALTTAYKHHGGTDPAQSARLLLAVALGAVLTAKVSA